MSRTPEVEGLLRHFKRGRLLASADAESLAAEVVRLEEAHKSTTEKFASMMARVRELEAQNARLRAALGAVATMPEYDQDDAHRLRNIGKVELAKALAGTEGATP